MFLTYMTPPAAGPFRPQKAISGSSHAQPGLDGTGPCRYQEMIYVLCFFCEKLLICKNHPGSIRGSVMTETAGQLAVPRTGGDIVPGNKDSARLVLTVIA